MSKCISVHGEYSEHEYTTKPVCDHCGQIAEMLALTQNEVMRTALEQIKETHRPVKVERVKPVLHRQLGVVVTKECRSCKTEHPCATYQHAEQGLAGGDRG